MKEYYVIGELTLPGSYFDSFQKYQNGSFRLCKSIRQYSKEKDKKDFCPPPHPKTGGTGTIYTIGALTLLSGGTLGLAKYNPDFRDWLKSQAPFTDPLIKFIFQEEMSYYAAIVATLNNLKDYLLSLVMGSEQVSNEIPERKKEYYRMCCWFSFNHLTFAKAYNSFIFFVWLC